MFLSHHFLTQVSTQCLLTGHRASSILQCSGSSLYVSSPSFVNSPERSLRCEGRSPFKADPLGVSGVLVNSGIGTCQGLMSQGVALHQPLPTHVLTMDASTCGWGVVCSLVLARGIVVG